MSLSIDRENQIWISWNGNIRHPFARLTAAEREESLAEEIRAASSVRLFGKGQSSADIAAGTSSLIDTRGYSRILSVDGEKLQISVEAGISLADLLRKTEELGWALPALPDIDTVTVGGALSTGTHGTCGELLSQYVVALRIITAAGELLEIDTADPRFEAFRCSLGLLGAISTVTFQCVPLRKLNLVEEPYRDQEWLARYPEWLAERDFVRILWLPHTGYGYVILGDYGENDSDPSKHSEPARYRYRRDVSARLYGLSARYPGFTPWANRIIRNLFFSARIDRRGSLYEATVTKKRNSTLELAEWSVAQDRFQEFFPYLKGRLNDRSNRAWAHLPMDVRFLNADRTWLSYAYDRPAVTVGCVTRHPETADSYAAFDLVEESFLSYDGRPHWGKRYKAEAAELGPLWPKWDEFRALREKLDPQGKFLTPYLRRLFAVD